VPTDAREPQAPLVEHHGHAVRVAADRALARRYEQGARPTFGDDADGALLDALAAVPPEDLAFLAPALAHAGESLGRHVYARRCFEDSMPGATAILSTTLLDSGWGSFRLEGWFHRSGHAAFTPGLAAARVGEQVLACYLSGVLAGYLGEAFNCRATAAPLDGLRFELRLHEGRDVNAWRRPS
jgi:hypothetical protein